MKTEKELEGIEAIKKHNCSDEANDTFCPICFNNGRTEATQEVIKMISNIEKSNATNNMRWNELKAQLKEKK